ncbi:MAG: PilZ domain-containing protein [Rhodospirillales bacterium]|nr:PilZ domain-containing protein [Alphaproteobacteria bacterium]MBL6948887.1 PilZ domain-containing protein [Rhodospirillales bacterium]
MSGLETGTGDERRINQRFDIERTLRAVANGELRLGRLTEVSAGSAAIHLDKDLEVGTEITLDIEDLGSYKGHVAGPPRDGLVPVKFDIDEHEEDHLIAEIMRVYTEADLAKDD